MPTWLKVLTVLVTLPAWLAVVSIQLIQGTIPSPVMMAIPAGIIIATSGSDVTKRAKKTLAKLAADEENGKP